MNRITKLIKLSTFLLFLFVAKSGSANIYYIDFKKIGYPAALQPEVEFLQQNVGIYDHWSPQWNAQIKQEVVVKHLTDLFNGLSAMNDKNTEAYLLLGDVGHYLYNINVDAYYQKAVDNYEQAVKLSPDDYRCYWFLGSHYSSSAVPIKAMETFEKGAAKLPANVEWGFWADYAFAAFLANMPATASYAMKQMEVIGGGNQNTQFLAGQIKESLHHVNKDTSLSVKDIWSVGGKAGDKLIFLNRLVGLKFLADSTWNLTPYDYKDQTTAVIVAPDKLKGKTTGQSIGYSIAVIVKVAKPGQSLDDFFSTFTKTVKSSAPVHLTDKFKNAIAVESKDPSIYPNLGGSYSYMMAFAAEEPPYPGIALEKADKLPSGKGLSYYKVAPKYTRLSGKLYYYVMLDTCKEIHDESLAIFRDFINNLVVE